MAKKKFQNGFASASKAIPVTAALSARRIFRKMAETLTPRLRLPHNLEHLKGILPEGPFSRYGDVVELKSEKIDDDSVLNGAGAVR